MLVTIEGNPFYSGLNFVVMNDKFQILSFQTGFNDLVRSAKLKSSICSLFNHAYKVFSPLFC